MSAPRTSQVFFDRDANNNPGGGDPNWYYYWSQTAANGATHPMRYGGHPRGTVELLAGGGWGIVMGPVVSNPPNAILWGGADGIDYFGWLTRHEDHHAMRNNQWFFNGWVAANDTDSDWMLDAAEPTFNPAYTVGNPTTYQDTFGYQGGGPLRDDEHECMTNQAAWGNSSANGVDWADPGMQHDHDGETHN